MGVRKMFRIIVLVGFVSGAGYWAWRRFAGDTKTIVAPTTDQVLEMDRKNLNANTGVNEHQIYAALVRLAQAGDPSAVDEALKRAHSPSEWVRSGVAEALGRSDRPEARRTLAELLLDPSEKVRVRSLHALGMRESAENRQMIERHLEQRPNVTPNERLEGHGSLIKQVPFAERKKHVESMVQIAQSLSGEEQLAAWLLIVSLAPREESVLNALDQISKKGAPGSDDLTALAIRHLGASAPERVRTRLFGLHKDKRMKVRLAAVQSLSTACPLERLDILSAVVEQEKESIVWRTAVQQAALLPSEKTMSLMKTLQARQMPEDDKRYVNDALRALESVKGSDPCRWRGPVTAAPARKTSNSAAK